MEVDRMLLYIALIMYILIMAFAYGFKIKWLYMIAGLIWFIPIAEIDNLFIITISVTMIIVHFMLGLRNENDDF